MTEIHANKSTSDVSIDSWTLIDDVAQDEDQKSTKSSDSVEIIDIDPETDDKKEEEVNEESEEEKKESFLTFDEFLRERLLDHDYEHAEKEQKSKKKSKKGARKRKAHHLGISVLIAIILALTAFATLCSTLSQTTVEKETEQVLPVNKVVVPKDPKQSDQILRDITDSLKQMEKMKNFKFNDTLQQCPRNSTPNAKSKLFLSKTFSEVLKSKIPKCDKINLKVNKFKQKKKSTWEVLKEFLLNKNFHALVSLIMTNIYLFTLLIDFTKKPINKNVSIQQLKQKFFEDLEKGNNVEEFRKYLFKELPFCNAEIVDKHCKKKVKKLSTNTSKSKVKLPKKTNTVTVLTETKKLDNLVFSSCPFLADQKSNKAFVSTINVEAGKSECQRRFDELDLYHRRFEQLKESQRNRIKLLKQKFKNEVSYIRDTEEESDTRAEKINKTSQKFIKKLKFNREKYLLELKKVKELRQKVADGKNKENRKDAAIGSYTVALPPIYDYVEKFKMIKEKFEKENKQLPKEWKFQ